MKNTTPRRQLPKLQLLNFLAKFYTERKFLMKILTLSTLKKKFGQILVCCKTNISNMFAAQDWILEIISRPFHDFIKMTI